MARQKAAHRARRRPDCRNPILARAAPGPLLPAARQAARKSWRAIHPFAAGETLEHFGFPAG
jgi:hypothetical protein